MPRINIDSNERPSRIWDAALVRLITARTTVTIEVDGTDHPVTGDLAAQADGGFLVVDTTDDGRTGTVTLVPIGRIITLRAGYRRSDLVAARRAAVAADQPFLDAVLAAVEAFAPQPAGSPMPGRLPTPSALLHEIDPAARRDRTTDHVADALAVLHDQGLLPTSPTDRP